jgi:hypothetical protein
MRHLALVSLLVLVACQGMYVEKPQKMRNPPIIKPSKDLPKDDVVQAPPTIDACDYRWVIPTKPVKRNGPAAEAKEREGDARTQIVSSATTPPDLRAKSLVDSIDIYGRALMDDPFNPTLTLKLALAYDKALRKGCAIALLGRLAKLSLHPTYEKATNLIVDEISDKKTYFDRYRDEALRAAGR